MKRVLEKFYEGNLNPSDAAFMPGGAYDAALRTLTAAEEKLDTCLEGDSGLRETFAAYRQAQEALNSVTAKEQFLRGFRLGVRMGMEIASDQESELPDIG